MYFSITGKDDSLAVGEVGLAHAVVVKLMEGLERQGHHVYTDNFYTSPALFLDLHSKGFGACGTVRVNRRGVPSEMQQRLQKGEVLSVSAEGPLLALKWMDKRPVTMLSTVHDASQVTKRRRSRLAPGGVEEIQKPLMVDQYNQFMGGVDRSDQLMAYYGFPHRTIKWWRRAFFHLLDLTVVQAHTLHRISPHAGPTLSHEQFRVQLAQQLIVSTADTSLSAGPSPLCQPAVERLAGRHFPARTASRDGHPQQLDCFICSCKKGRGRKTTTYICKQCSLPMFIVPCFQLHHTKLDPTRYLYSCL